MLKEAQYFITGSAGSFFAVDVTVDVAVDESIIRIGLHKFDLHGRNTKGMPFLSKKNIQGNNVDRWVKDNQTTKAFDQMNPIPTVKHSSESVMALGCFAALPQEIAWGECAAICQDVEAEEVDL